jgi:trans-aconitate 2-methyltransferase
MDWDPGQYARFATPRLRPALDLLQRLPALEPRRIYDLGCGSGEITRLLAARWPDAQVWGVDDSAAMLAAAPQDSSVQWIRRPLQDFRASDGADLIFSNAALHWLPAHAQLMQSLAQQLRPGGVLAVQMPRNFDQPSHTLIAAAAREGPWRPRLERLIQPSPVGTARSYYELLAPFSCELDIWETRYLHILEGDDPVKEWTKGTWLRPFLEALDEPDRSAFESAYARLLRGAYPRDSAGKTPFEFNRLFLVMRRR